MDSGARVEQAVFDFLRPQLRRHRADSADLTRSVAGAIAGVVGQADSAVSARRWQLSSARDQLAACLRQEDADCSWCVSRVQDCERHLQQAIMGRDLINQTSAAFAHQQARYRAAVDQLLQQAERIVGVADERTRNYQAVAQPFSDGSGAAAAASAAPESVSWRDLPGVSVPAYFPSGFALIPITLIVSDDPPPSGEDVNARQDSPALRWSAGALLDVVLPTMSSEADVVGYLRDRDARERLSGERSYSATYSGFFSPDSAIRLKPRSDGRFDIVDGRHRLRILARAGAQSVPALIGGA
jgi:hypothetical protein